MGNNAASQRSSNGHAGMLPLLLLLLLLLPLPLLLTKGHWP
jgi:hypothetical protein